MASITRIDLADNANPTPEEKAQIRKRLEGREMTPSTRSQSEYYQFFREQTQVLGQPYDVTRIPISVCQQMQRDPMLAFGMHFLHLPVMRANWHIKCERPDIAAFVDNALRSIHATYIAQRAQAMFFGFAPIVKRFQLEKPNWTYEKDGEQVKVWNNGNIEAVTWKPFVGLPSDPVIVEPRWDGSGAFNGIKWNGGANPLPFSALENPDGSKDIPLELALWITNEKASVTGSLYGYPHVGYAYRYWWSYWFRWALYDRFFERKADPPYVVYYPAGQGADYGDGESEDSTPVSNKNIALGIGDSAKGGGTIAFPGNTIDGYDDRPTSIRQWMIEELKVKGDMTHFVENFEYLDVMKLRSLWIPEQALMEGKGGCLAQGTPIACPRDHDKYPNGKPIEKIRPGDFVWSYNEAIGKHQLMPVKNVWLTEKQADVWKLTLDNGEEIIATPDHPFMSRDGVWRELQELKPGDRLMPLYERKRDSYYDGRKAINSDYEPMICLEPDREKFEFEYREISKYFDWVDKGKKLNVHHIDERHANTDLENLEPLSPSEHAKRHFEDEHWRARFSDRVKEAMAKVDRNKLGHTWTEEQKQTQAIHGLNGIEKLRDRFTEEEWKEFCSARATKGWETRRKNAELAKQNHRVVSVEPYGKADVWDIEIDGPGYCKNYIANGVVVHNTSSRNVASEEISIHKEGAASLAAEIDSEQNRWVIPDIIAANYPEFDGPVEKVTTGFTDADEQILKESLNLIGQNDATELRHIDVRELLSRLGMPIVSLKEIQRQQEEAQKELEKSTPPVVNPDAQGNAGVNQQGFYVEGRPTIALAESDNFVTKLPKTKHYSDEAIVSQAKALRQRWNKELKAIYEDFADFISKQEFSLEDYAFAESLDLDAKLVPNKPGVTNWVEKLGGLPKPIADVAGDLISERGFSTGHAIATAVNRAKKLCAQGNAKYCRAVEQWEKMKAKAKLSDQIALSNELNLATQSKIINSLVDKWTYSRERLNALLSDSQSITKKVIDRAGKRELKRIKSDAQWKPDNSDIADYLSDRGATYVRSVDETVKDELKTFLANEIAQDKTVEEIASDIRNHFSDFPSWKADRLARTEVMLAYNHATLLAGERAGVKVVQANDARQGPTDAECEHRAGKFFSIGEALSETLKTHPNDTLEWKLTTLDKVPEVVRASETPTDSLATYDEDNNVIYFAESIPEEIETKYLLTLGDLLTNE